MFYCGILTHMKTIKVTQKHIDQGLASVRQNEPQDEDTILASQCPVALALAEQLPSISVAKVWDDHIEFFAESVTRMDLPKSVASFVRRFNNRKELKPFNFKIDDQAIKRSASQV